ncbi:MAG TPA: hypothetical protein VGM39_09180 [Kofleriaceae bacterium]|jgi:hypothetical protein
MRLLCLLTVTLTAAIASADAPSVNFEVVHVLPDTQQVLVLDKERNTHVLLTIGSAVGDDVVVEIDGIGMTLETRENERFTVYPRAAQGLALNLDKGAKKDVPAVYSSVEPAHAPTQTADNPALDEFATALASVFFGPPALEGGETSSLIVSLK